MNNNRRHLIAFNNARAKVLGPLVTPGGDHCIILPVLVAHVLAQNGEAPTDANRQKKWADLVAEHYTTRPVKGYYSPASARTVAVLAISILAVADLKNAERKHNPRPGFQPKLDDYIVSLAPYAVAFYRNNSTGPGGAILANAARLITQLEHDPRFRAAANYGAKREGTV